MMTNPQPESFSFFPSSRLGIQVSSFRPILTTKEEVDHAFEMIQNMHCRTVQLQWIDFSVPTECIADSLKKHDLISISVQEIYETFLAHKDYYLDLCQKTGSTWLCVSRIPKDRKTPSALPAFFEELKALMTELQERGMKLCFHPVSADYEPISFMEKDSLDATIDPISAMMRSIPDMELCLDLYHCLRSGIDVPQMLARYRDRICMVHFKESQKRQEVLENGITREKEVLVPLGTGDTNWKDILKACQDTCVPYAFAEQESWEGDPFEMLEKSFTFLSDHLAFPSAQASGTDS